MSLAIEIPEPDVFTSDLPLIAAPDFQKPARAPFVISAIDDEDDDGDDKTSKDDDEFGDDADFDAGGIDPEEFEDFNEEDFDDDFDDDFQEELDEDDFDEDLDEPIEEADFDITKLDEAELVDEDEEIVKPVIEEEIEEKVEEEEVEKPKGKEGKKSKKKKSKKTMRMMTSTTMTSKRTAPPIYMGAEIFSPERAKHSSPGQSEAAKACRRPGSAEKPKPCKGRNNGISAELMDGTDFVPLQGLRSHLVLEPRAAVAAQAASLCPGLTCLCPFRAENVVAGQVQTCPTRNHEYAMFQPAPSNAQFPKLEEEILQFWRERDIYEKSLQRRAGAKRFVFYEGPPTANGMPHPGHCLTRAIKDLFPRYRTMRGYLCERKAGWDTHGLPVEVEVCKEMGIHAKEEIEAFGIEPFIHKCQESVWRYMKQWELLTERLGFWIKLEEAYVTYHQSYVESVWWSLKNLFDRGLLYQGHKIVWWWAQGGTALSSGEVGQGYRDVADPSVYVLFPLLDDAGRRQDGYRHITARLDDHTLDVAEQSVRGRASGFGLCNGCGRRDGAAVSDGCGVGGNDRWKSKARTENGKHVQREAN